MDLLIHAANLLFVASHLARDLVRLRLLSVAGTACLALFFATRPDPLWTAVAWNLLFLGLNLAQFVRLRRARRAP